LLPLSAVFRTGVKLRRTAYALGWLKTRHLERPVISIGNLTVGGTGKTPLVASVAKLLLRNNLKPSILTRGYGRTNKANLIAIPPGGADHANAREIGDEPALLARMLPEVPLVLCADRFHGGQVAERQFGVDAHILDDGFQHLALARNLDLVAVDATQPISEWGLLPVGRQREPLSSLARAQIVVITRSDAPQSPALRDQVLKANPNAKIFLCQTVVQGWLDAWTGEAMHHEKLRTRKVAAFCGIGNPGAFFGDLRRWGFNVVQETAFPDHHLYTRGDIDRLVDDARKNGAVSLLTTQKDAVKFSRDWTPKLPILSCQIEAQILDAGEFEKTVLSYLPKARS
jgi:tetraacyldisaccharide 4'-kinase